MCENFLDWSTKFRWTNKRHHRAHSARIFLKYTKLLLEVGANCHEIITDFFFFQSSRSDMWVQQVDVSCHTPHITSWNYWKTLKKSSNFSKTEWKLFQGVDNLLNRTVHMWQNKIILDMLPSTILKIFLEYFC